MNPPAFADFFSLREKGRSSFELDPQRDAELYLDLDGSWTEIEKVLTNSTYSEAPKLLIEGDYGTGKSHLLRKIEAFCKNAKPPTYLPIYLELSGFGRRSDYLDVHKLVMRHILNCTRKSLQTYVHNSENIKDKISSILGDCGVAADDVVDTLLLLAAPSIGDTDSEIVRTAKKWLTGHKLLARERRMINVQVNLAECCKPPELVGLCKFFAEIERRESKRTVLLLIDETEAFTAVVDPDAKASIGHGMRALFDPSNKSCGIFLGLNMPGARMSNHPILRRDVSSRMKNKKILLQPLNTEVRRGQFMTQLWPKLSTIDPKEDSRVGPFLLTPDAQELIQKRLRDLHDALDTNSESSGTAPTQRELLAVLSLIGAIAREEQVRPIDRSSIMKWLELAETQETQETTP